MKSSEQRLVEEETNLTQTRGLRIAAGNNQADRDAEAGAAAAETRWTRTNKQEAAPTDISGFWRCSWSFSTPVGLGTGAATPRGSWQVHQISRSSRRTTGSISNSHTLNKF